jgi:hypothetical protein
VENLRYAFQLGVRLVMSLGIGAITACGSQEGLTGADLDEPVASAEQPIIPGAAISQVTRTLVLPAGGSLLAQSVTCPAGSVMVGGGYLIAAVGANARVHASYGVGNSWTISVINLSNTNSSGVDVYAQCLSGTSASSSVVWSSLISVPAGSVGSAGVSCPTGVLSGGGYNGTTAVHAWQNYPRTVSGGARWEFTAVNKNTSASTSFRSQAICLQGVTGSTHVRTKQASIAAGAQAKIVSDPCPTETLLSSGGHYVSVFFGSDTPYFVKGQLRNFQNPSLWNLIFVNNSTATATPELKIACLELWP